MPAVSPGTGTTSFALRLHAARMGDLDALEKMLKDCVRILRHAARARLPADLQAKGSGSDLVQDTFLEALRDFH